MEWENEEVDTHDRPGLVNPILKEKGPISTRSGIMGIILASICLIMLLMVLLMPWMTIEREDWNTGDKEWKTMDFWGNGYLGKTGEEDKIIDKDAWDEMDKLDNGRWLSLWGVIIGLVLAIFLTVFGFIKVKNNEGMKILSMIRTMLGVFMIVPSAFLMVGGAKFIGLCISMSTSGKDPMTWFPIQPIINLIVGLIILVLALILISFERGIIRKRNEIGSRNLPWKMQDSSDSMIKWSRMLVILFVIILVTFPMLPMMIGITRTEEDNGSEETRTSFVSQAMFDFYDYDDDSKISKATSNYGVFNTMMWVSLCISLFGLAAGLFFQANWSPMTFNILALVSDLVIISLIIGIIFKIIAVVQTFDHDKVEYDYMGTVESSVIFGYNYIPIIALFIASIVGIIYVSATIRSNVVFFKGYGANEANMGPILDEDIYHRNQKKNEIVMDTDPFAPGGTYGETVPDEEPDPYDYE